MKTIVTPWKVQGKVDYERLINEFGTQKLSKALLDRIGKHCNKVHHLLRREIFFSHRDLNWILDEYEKGNKFFLYTGRGPSGKIHIGHIVPWMLTKWLQKTFNVELYFQLTDDEKFLFNDKLTLEDTQNMAMDNALDIIAMGFDPKKTFIFTNVQMSKTMYPLALRVAKKLNFSTAKSVFGFSNETNVGQIFFTTMQSVPAFMPSVMKGKNVPCLIPHAIDQDAHFRISRDILPKLGYYKPASIHCKFLPGLLGPEGKMSSSAENTTVYTTDSPNTVKRKVNKYAYSGGRDTIEEHRKKGGMPEVDVAFQWLTFFEEDDRLLADIEKKYRSGKMLSGELKKILIDKLNTFLCEHQKRREHAKGKLKRFLLQD